MFGIARLLLLALAGGAKRADPVASYGHVNEVPAANCAFQQRSGRRVGGPFVILSEKSGPLRY